MSENELQEMSSSLNYQYGNTKLTTTTTTECQKTSRNCQKNNNTALFFDKRTGLIYCDYLNGGCMRNGFQNMSAVEPIRAGNESNNYINYINKNAK